MASTDARPVPRKNAAYRVTFPIFDADGDLVTGASGLDSEVSIDQGTFADCTNEATEIATSSGIYYLDLTSSEMNGDTVAIIVKTSSTGAKTTPIVLYPEEAGDIRVNVTQIEGSDATDQIRDSIVSDATRFAGADIATIKGYIDTEIASIISTLSTIAGYVDTEVAAIKAKTDQLTFGTANRLDAQVHGMEAGVVTAAAIATGAIDADALAADAVTEIWSKAMSDLSAVPAANASALDALNWCFERLRNGRAQTATTETIYKDDGTTPLANAAKADNGTTLTVSEFS